MPVACDLFSVRALATLGTALSRWIGDAATIASIAPDEAPVLKGKPEFLGYIPQRFKTYGRTMAQQPSRYFRQIRRRVYADVSSVLRRIEKSLAPPSEIDPLLGAVKDFASLAQAAQREGVPVWECESYARPDEQSDAREVFGGIADLVLERTDG